MSDDDDELNELLGDGKADRPTRSRPRATLADEPGHEAEVEKKLTRGYCQWTSSDNKIFVPAGSTRDFLTPGVYEINQSPTIGTYFEKIPVKTEGLIRFPDSNSDVVVAEIEKFWASEAIFRDFGLTYKRGILLWGPPGSGKSSLIQLIMKDVIERGGVVLRFDDPYVFMDGMRILRTIQPETPVVAMMEDLDSILRMYSETEVLNILDGVNQIERIVFLATTNYPKELGARIVNRPSRFDKRFKIGWPNAASRKMYFEHLFERAGRTAEGEGVDLAVWVADTIKLSIAHLKELFIDVMILGNDYKKAIKTITSMKEHIDDKDEEKKMGFVATQDEDID